MYTAIAVSTAVWDRVTNAASVAVSSGWLSVYMLLGDVGDTDIHKQHDAALMEMRACLIITSCDLVTMHRSQQLREY